MSFFVLFCFRTDLINQAGPCALIPFGVDKEDLVMIGLAR